MTSAVALAVPFRQADKGAAAVLGGWCTPPGKRRPVLRGAARGATRYLSDPTGIDAPSALRYDAFGKRSASGGVAPYPVTAGSVLLTVKARLNRCAQGKVTGRAVCSSWPAEDTVKLITYCYLSYPDFRPLDPTCAATEMWVIVGQEGDTIEHHEGTYAFEVYTYGYLQQEFVRRGRPLIGRAVMLVPTLADDWMGTFLEGQADMIPDLGEER
jgi:hypothetical protein